ncbi:nmrA-family protein [Gloeopeniophorella convolvens]|nr:nmrA-family protein [Gloeopeniophorella convolvens]
MSKLILVLGATGAQGRAVINSLLAPSTDGTPSPYTVRALTRDPSGKHARNLEARGVELAKGDTSDLASVKAALEGAYGAWINVDGFTVGEQREIYAGLRIFELAKQTPTLRHYVWSNLDYNLKKGGYNQKYRCEHYDAKGRVAEWMTAQPSVVSDTEMSWSVVTTGPYMEMLNIMMFGPTRRADGTFVFHSPIGDGHVPMIALADLGFFARWTFDHRAETSARDLEVASEMVGWEALVAAFVRVTGQPAVHGRESVQEWVSHIENAQKPVAAEGAPDSTTWAENFSGWWSAFRDDVIKRDMEWIRKINPNGYTAEKWMVEKKYDGVLYKDPVLKIIEDAKLIRTRKA